MKRGSSDIVFADLFDEGRAAHVEQASGSRDNAIRGLHGLTDQVLLELLQAFLQIGVGKLHGLGHIVGLVGRVGRVARRRSWVGTSRLLGGRHGSMVREPVVRGRQCWGVLVGARGKLVGQVNKKGCISGRVRAEEKTNGECMFTSCLGDCVGARWV